MMREITAYIRPALADPVVHGLESIGVKAMTVIPVVEGIGALADGSHGKLSLKYLTKYSRIYKLEIVCREEDEEQITSLIQRLAHTGESGDGVIFVAKIDRAIKIRTGEEGHFTLDSAERHEA